MAKREGRTYVIPVRGYKFNQIEDEIQSFIIVPDDQERGYEIGDILTIQKHDGDNKKLDKKFTRTIKGFQKNGQGLMTGFIVLGLEK